MNTTGGWRFRSSCVAALTAGGVLVCASCAHAAIAYVGSSTAQTASTGATTLAVAKPTSVSSGQIEIATISALGSSTITAPTGWNLILSTPVGTTMQQATYWHLAGASEGTSTWTFATSSKATGGISAYSGVDTTAIVDAAGSGTGTSGSIATEPSVTADYAGDYVIGTASFNNAGTLSAGSSTTQRWTSTLTGNSTGPATLAQDATKATSGATTAQTVTDATAATAWIGQTVALKAASASGELTVSTSAAPTFAASLNSGDTTSTYSAALNTIASLSPPPGWNETITSTTFTAGTHTLPANASAINAVPTIACLTSAANCVAATNTVSYPVAIPAAATAPTAVKFLNASSGTGAGEFTVTPTVTVTVPQNAFAGSYASTVTIQIVSGP